MITRLLARGIGVARISRNSKKEVQHHRYRLICKYILLFFIILNVSCLRQYAGDDTHTHWCHFHEWIDTWITHRDQQYMAWLKKVDDDVRKCECEKAERGNDAGRE